MDNERELSSREQLIEAVKRYLGELARYERVKREFDEIDAELMSAGQDLESVYFNGTAASTGKIIVQGKTDRVFMIELGRDGRVYPKVVEIETYVEL